MVVFGLIIVLLAGGLFAGFVLGGANDTANLQIGSAIVEVSTLTIFLLGALVMMLLALGFALMRSGARRASQRRKDSKELTRLNKKLARKEQEGARAGSAHSSSSGTRSSGTTAPSGTSATLGSTGTVGTSSTTATPRSEGSQPPPS